MFKTIALIKANIKRFMRDWKAIFLLIIFPLILIGVVFISFNPAGLRKVPIGVIGSTENFNINEYKEHLTYLNINNFNSKEECIKDLQRYNSYVCIEVTELAYREGVILNVYYDNTREPIIWEIIERIKSTVDYFQKEMSKDIAKDFISIFHNTGERMDTFQVNLVDVHGKINSYISDIDGNVVKLKGAKRMLVNSLNDMDQNIEIVKSIKTSLRKEKDRFYNQGTGITIFFTEPINQVNYLKRSFNNYNDITNDLFIDADRQINEYEDLSRKGRRHISEIDTGVSELGKIRSDLVNYKLRLKDTQDEIKSIREEYKSFEKFDVETLVNPIVVKNIPTYSPNLNKNKEQQIIERLNLMSLQTIFPMILLLIILFISLLISSFICLSSINSSAHKRIKLIKGVFFPEVLAVYLSSFMIILIPLLCVLVFGDLVFKIAIFFNIGSISLLIFFLISCFILLGMALAYLIKKESITLLVTTFLLVFLIFFSGFLLPIERMSYISAVIAGSLPGKIALSVFNKVVFYNASFLSLSYDFTLLGIWAIGLFLIVILIKKLRRS